uniref:Uncharacterized protein n=1 Tax=viral metagenome TaxID=1070528 RepID=A0A6H2A606_9ZZZZ
MERTKEEKLEIARTILAQLGGHKFTVMTGAKNIFALENGLQFALPGNGGFTKYGINRVQVILDPSDTYTVKFMKIRKMEKTYEIEYGNVYCDSLQSVFREATGLDTHL